MTIVSPSMERLANLYTAAAPSMLAQVSNDYVIENIRIINFKANYAKDSIYCYAEFLNGMTVWIPFLTKSECENNFDGWDRLFKAILKPRHTFSAPEFSLAELEQAREFIENAK